MANETSEQRIPWHGKSLRLKVRAHIFNTHQEILLIYIPHRHGPSWEMPGGGVKVGETLEQALFRELNEELGVNRFKILMKMEAPSFEMFAPETLELLGLDYEGQYINDFILQAPVDRLEINPPSHEVISWDWVSYSNVPFYLSFPGQFELYDQVYTSQYNLLTRQSHSQN